MHEMDFIETFLVLTIFRELVWR